MGAKRGENAAVGTASGLRPASAFVLIGVVLLAVSGKAAHLTLFADGDQPDPDASVTAPWAEFELCDREGRPLALSVECFDLTASPRSLWRSHTPDRIANALAAELLDEPAAELLERLLPPAPEGESVGLVRVQTPRLLRFDLEAAAAVDQWLLTGGVEQGEGRIEGIWLYPLGDGTYTLEWAPALALREAARLQHLGEDHKGRPDLWTRRLLRDLATLVQAAHPDGLPPEVAEVLEGRGKSERGAMLRDAIWAELMPTTFKVLRRKVEPVVAHALNELFASETISPWQIQLVPRLDRRHPTRPEATQPVLALRDGDEAPPVLRDDAFSILGHWGVLGREDALARARIERDATPHRLEWSGTPDPVARRAWELETAWRPWSGLELCCATELSSPRWPARLAAAPRTYTHRRRSVARDRRTRWEDRRVPDYFGSAVDALEVPRCETTLDAELQQVLHAEMLGLLDEFKAAVAQAIVLDVETGEVLAVDGAYAYDISGFAPIRHVFTPGSTMKAVVMAIALDQGVVKPEQSFETFAPNGITVRDGRSKRSIREALGAPKESTVTAAEGLAHSVNAVLVQIGLRVPAPVLRQQFLALGYGARPEVGLGPESAGHVPPLDRKGSWSRPYAHASVSFGHELGVTLWQHAQALGTIARGGRFLPLRILRAVEQEGQRWEFVPPEGVRVLSEQACQQVREMMAMGAREGTGDDVASPEHCPEFDYIGTKTGTTEKVPSEVSLHVEWPRQLELREQGKPWSSAEYKALVGKRNNLGIRNTCYTSSMCVIGRVGGRELLTLVVVDEPRSKAKFGAAVAGAAAVRILRRAHGLVADVDAALPEPDAPGKQAFNQLELPWAAVNSEGSWGR